jgi:uncharacterized lipoprotein
MKKLLLLSVIVLFTTACSSGWSCKKRYVKQDKHKTNINIKNC